MDIKNVIITIYHKFIDEHDDKALKLKTDYGLNDVFLSINKKDNLYTVMLHNINKYQTFKQILLENVDHDEAKKFALFFVIFANKNADIFTYYTSVKENNIDTLSCYLMVNSVIETSFDYDDLDEFIELYETTGYFINYDKKESFDITLENDNRRKKNTYDHEFESVLKLIDKIPDQYKKDLYKELVTKNPYSLYESLDKPDKTKLLELYYDKSVLDIDVNLDYYITTFDLKFNKLLYNYQIKKMLSSEVGKAYKNILSPTMPYEAINHNLRLMLYQNLIIDLNTNSYIYRLDNLSNDQLIDKFKNLGIPVILYKDYIKNNI